MKLLACIFALAGMASAAEYAVFATGARLRVDRHELEAGKVRLYSGGGFMELASAEVVRFEREEEVAVTTPPAPVLPPAAEPTTHELIDNAAEKYGLPRQLLHSIVKQESAYRASAVSPKGAIGLMQLMPDTAKMLGANPHDPVQNVDAGTRYLRALLEKYDGNLWHALAAYNAGPGALQKYGGKIPPYRETREYIRRIAASMPAE